MRKTTRVGSVAVRNLWGCVCWGLAVWLWASSSWGAMEIQGIVNGTEPASNYDRFDNSPWWIGNPAEWPGGAPPVNNPYPWSGVGRDATQGRWATLISPSFIISANHFAPGIGDTIQFFNTNNPNGASETRTVVASEWLQASVPGDQGDVWIGELSSPTIGLATYPILKMPAGPADPYGGLGISTFGISTDSPGTATSVRLGRNVINANTAEYYSFDPALTGVSNAYAYQFTYDNPGVGPDESQVIVGDSGGPSFFLYAGGTPALLGLHWFNNDPSDTLSGDTWLTNYASDIQTGMNQLAVANTLQNSAAVGETVKTISPMLGDFNLDGHVTAADISAMEAALANLTNYESVHGMNDAYLDGIGDLNHDGKVNTADLQMLINWLKTGHGSTDTVPEPPGWVLLVLGGLGLVVWGQVRRSRIRRYLAAH